MLTKSADAVLADRLRLTVGRLARRLRQQSLGGLTPSQRSVLATLDREGPMTLGRLAEVERISAPSASGISGRLAERGLVEKRPHPDDGRSALLGLTARGRSTLVRGHRERTAYLVRRLEVLSEEERDILRRAVEALDRLVEPP